MGNPDARGLALGIPRCNLCISLPVGIIFRSRLAAPAEPLRLGAFSTYLPRDYLHVIVVGPGIR